MFIRARIFDQERDFVSIEGLHEGEITCVAFSSRGDVMISGSKDSSLRLWNIERLGQGKIEHLCTFVGHAGTVLCVDLCAEFHVVVSGSSDYSVYCWDYLSGKLLRSLEGHENPVVSVSVSSLSGYICTLTCSDLRVFSINGDPLANACYTGGVVGDASIFAGRVVLAAACAEWQDGVTALTGHDNGQVLLWRIRREVDTKTNTSNHSISIDIDSNYVAEGLALAGAGLKGDLAADVGQALLEAATAVNNADGGKASSALTVTATSSDNLDEDSDVSPHSPSRYPSHSPVATPQPPRPDFGAGNNYTNIESGINSPMSPPTSPQATPRPQTKIKRKLVPFMLAKTHRAHISVLRICSNVSTSNTTSRRELIDKSYENAGTIELYVGDLDGYISRWSAAQLSQFTNAELLNVVNSTNSSNVIASTNVGFGGTATTAMKKMLSSNRGRTDTIKDNITRSASNLLMGTSGSSSSSNNARESRVGSMQRDLASSSPATSEVSEMSEPNSPM
jgi:WD40 repeat protein